MEQSPLDHSLSEEQGMIAAAVAEFADEHVAPRIAALDRAGVHPQELWEELAGMGLLGTLLPEEQGGSGAGFLAHVVTVENLARVGGLAGVLPAAQGIVIHAVSRSGDGDAGAAHLEGLGAGTAFGAPALLEADAGYVATLARGDGSEVALTGEKVLVPHPGRASCFLVRARRAEEDLLVLVESGAPGLAHGGSEHNLGLRGYETATLSLADTPGRVLGASGLLSEVVSGARIVVAALLCGVARGALDHAVRYAGERVQFDLPIRDLTAIQERLARSDARVEALRALVHGAAGLCDAGLPHAQAARRARLVAAEAAMAAAHDALQVFGGYGYSREYPAERCYRDARFIGFGEHVNHQLLSEAMEALEFP